MRGQLASFQQTTNGTTSENLSVLFNNNGDRTSQGDSVRNSTTTYTYDMAGRLISYAKGSTSANYTDNGDGLRVAKTVSGGSAERFVWDVAEGMPLLIQDGTTKEITGPGGLPLEQEVRNGDVRRNRLPMEAA